MRLLDADIMIDVSRHHPPALQWVASLPDWPHVSGIARMELIAGCVNKAEVARVKALAAPYPSVWPAPADGQYALDLFAQYRLSHGQGATLRTFNVKHFAAVPGLMTEQPFARI